jgi:hypothetical protein
MHAAGSNAGNVNSFDGAATAINSAGWKVKPGPGHSNQGPRSRRKGKIFLQKRRLCLYASKRIGVFFFLHLGLVNAKNFCDEILPI